jgi:hypothetical protein
MPAPDRLSALQEQGLLPNQLPDYSLSWPQYAFGYSLWIVLAGLVVFELAKTRLRRARN